MENIMLLILGVFISVMGIVNIKGNISTIHSYNRRKAVSYTHLTLPTKLEV